jgi:hypothetical protein
MKTQGRDKKYIQRFFNTPEGKRLLRKSRYKTEDNIKMGILDIRCNSVTWIHSSPSTDRCRAVMVMAMSLQVIRIARKS